MSMMCCYSARRGVQKSAARRKTVLPVLIAATIASTALCGCSKGPVRVEVQPVEGQVLFNGKPLEGAQVVFYRQGEAGAEVRAPRARTGPDGRFRLGTYDQTDGAPEGQYVVTVVHFPMVKMGGDTAPGPNVLPQKYASPKTSDLRLLVAKGASTLPALQLKGPGREETASGPALQDEKQKSPDKVATGGKPEPSRVIQVPQKPQFEGE
jgi:hypothetical protein